MPIDVDKIMVLRSLGASLAEKAIGDVNLLLYEAGLNEINPEFWNDNDRWGATTSDRANAVITKLRDLPRSEIDAVALAVSAIYDEDLSEPERGSVFPVSLFASHLSTQRDFVGAVGRELEPWGVALFVAHDTIEPDEEWHKEIERVLSTCHAGVAFLLPELINSKWCDQEIGWLLGRGVPCLALKFQGQDPYGPLGKKQARTVADAKTATELADDIVDWLTRKPELARQLNASLVEALKGSKSFNKTDRIWVRLHGAEGMPAAQVAGLLTAIRDNDQVYNASGGTGEEVGPYKELVLKLALRQPGFEENLDLAREVAGLRQLEHVLLDAGITAPAEDPWRTAAPF